MSSSASDSTWNLASVQLQVSEAVQVYAELMASRHAQMLQALGPRRFESPIEAVFWIWWSTLEAAIPGMDFGFALTPQHSVQCEGATYRLDFAVLEHKIAVELDGHDFHEKTKEQVIYRNLRDRRLQAEGWTVLHFSGSELYRAPVEVVSSVVELARERSRGTK